MSTLLLKLINKKQYILDKVKGAVVAFSLRKLRKQYNGFAIKVRRSSDNAEKDIGFIGQGLDTVTLMEFTQPNLIPNPSMTIDSNSDGLSDSWTSGVI
jgi:hypothetical protein